MYVVVKDNSKKEKKRHLIMERAKMMNERLVEVVQVLELDAKQCLGS